MTLTVPEGWRLEQLAVRIEELHLGLAEDLARTAQAPREHGLAPPEGIDSLEGYLFPETYQIDQKATTIQILQTMLQQFDKRVDERLRQQATDGGLSLHQAVTLASIIEREARDPNERPIISSVSHNRLASGMRLDADPTVQYAVASIDLNAALGYRFWKHDLTAPDLEVDS